MFTAGNMRSSCPKFRASPTLPSMFSECSVSGKSLDAISYKQAGRDNKNAERLISCELECLHYTVDSRHRHNGNSEQA